MRFASVEQVREWAEKAARADWEMYLSFRSDFNPYCTDDARHCWIRGFTGASPRSWEADLRWDYQYQRGAAANRIIQEIFNESL